MTTTTLHGDCIDILPTLPPASVQCIVTSPPYFGLRDYGLPPTLWPTIEYTPLAGLPSMCIQGCDPDCAQEAGHYCQLCGGWRGCLGLEPDPLMFIAHLVYVFRLARPVLADDGVCWVNLGDTYASHGLAKRACWT